MTFTYQASDSRALSVPATVTIRVDGVNDPPEANHDSAVTDEDTPIAIDVLANDFDPEGQPLSIGYFDTEALVMTSTVNLITGTAGLITPTLGVNELTFDPDGDFETMTEGDSGFVWFIYQVTDIYGLSSTANVSVTVNGVNDPPVFLNEPITHDVQYSDYISPTTITVYDVDADSLSLSQVGLPDSLSFVDQGCDDGIRPSTCTALITGTLQVPAGTYTATISAGDGLITTTQTITMNVSPEDTKLTFDGNNPVAVQVTAPESNASEPFDIIVTVEELEPDLAAYLGAPGKINLAQVSMTLEPVGPGSPVTGACIPTTVDPVTGYDDVLTVTCSFAGVPVNTYSIALLVDGGYYTGYSEDVVVIYDPSLGFTTGGGWFYWPGSADPAIGYPGDKTNFGYTMKYNGPMTNIQGSLLLVRHLANGRIYRLKSNAIEGLSLGDVGSFGWASFAGKGTYLEPGWPDPIGNHTFLFYVEDHNEPGNGLDKVWLEVRDKDDVVIEVMSMTRPGAGNAVEINGGNVVVPHSGGTGNQPPLASFSYEATGLDVIFTDLSSDPGGSIVAWNWDFGDGTTGSDQHPLHSFAAAGTYDVSLTVTDNNGATDTTNQQVTVTDGSTAGAMYIAALEGNAYPNGNKWTAEVTITVMDENGNLVEGTVVTGSWSDGASGTSTCTTDINGQCTVIKDSINGNRNSVTFTVDEVSHDTLIYNETLNVITFIIVNKP